jgi:hypothetical protein
MCSEIMNTIQTKNEGRRKRYMEGKVNSLTVYAITYLFKEKLGVKDHHFRLDTKEGREYEKHSKVLENSILI